MTPRMDLTLDPRTDGEPTDPATNQPIYLEPIVIGAPHQLPRFTYCLGCQVPPGSPKFSKLQITATRIARAALGPAAIYCARLTLGHRIFSGAVLALLSLSPCSWDRPRLMQPSPEDPVSLPGSSATNSVQCRACWRRDATHAPLLTWAR